MDPIEYNQIFEYHLNKTIPNTCIDNLSRNAFVRKSKRYHYSDGVLRKNGRTVVSASAAWETLKHIHDVILDHHGEGKALEGFTAERYDIYKLRDICRSLTSFCTVCAYRRLVTIEGKRMVQISEKKRITICGALGLEPKEKLPFNVRDAPSIDLPKELIDVKDCATNRYNCFLACISTRLTGSINNSEALVVAWEVARESYLKKWYDSYYFPRIDLNQSLKERGIQTIDLFALAKIMGVHIIVYDADNGIWGYYAGNNRGCENGAIHTWFETRKDNEAHSMLVVGALNKPKEPKPKSRRY